MAPLSTLLGTLNLDQKILSVKQVIIIALVAWYAFVEYDSIQDTKKDVEIQNAKIEYNNKRAERVAKREALVLFKDMQIIYLKDQLQQCRDVKH